MDSMSVQVGLPTGAPTPTPVPPGAALAAQALAEPHGLVFSMMPTHFADQPGSGMHFHVSLWKGRGDNAANLFMPHSPDGAARPQDGLSPLGRQFVAGVLAHAPALCALAAPTVNSYKRLVRRGAMNYFSWAPVFNSYGSNNRTNSVRIPAGGGRCGSRNADGAVNPYLAAALALAAGLEGIREGLNPGAPNEDNLYELSDAQRRERGIEFLPQTLQEAVQAFADDPLVERTLGKGLRDEFIKYKTQEWETYHLSVSEWEVERYSHMF